MRAIAFSIVGAFLAAGCSAPPLEFPDWKLPVEEGTPVHEYAGVPIAAREGDEIGAVEDLVLGADTSDPQQSFYRVAGVSAAADGTIFVLDRGNHRIQVFDAGGRYVRTLGRQGEGPGEFDGPFDMAITGDGLVLRASTRRFSVWSLDGEHVRDIQMTTQLYQFLGVDDGLMANSRTRIENPDQPRMAAAQLTYARFNTDLELQEVYTEWEEPPPLMVEVGQVTLGFSGAGPISPWATRVAAVRDGTFLITTSEEYELHAHGARRWSLRSTWDREPVTQRHIDNMMAGFAEPPWEGLQESDFDWTDRFSAIDNLEVDGHGHIYVFPFFEPLDAPQGPDAELPKIDRPVDVYSADGERLYTGTISIPSWNGSLGDFVYRSRINRETGEAEVVRHRLVEPFR